MSALRKATEMLGADDVQPASHSVALIGELFTPVAIVQDEKTRDSFFAFVKAKLSQFEPDLTTDKGRKAMASMAFECNKAKAEVERAVKAMTEEWRDKTTKANAARKTIIDDLEALRVEFRKPLTDWEQAEEDRKRAVQAFFDTIDRMVNVTINDTSATVADRLAELQEMKAEVTPVTFDDRQHEASEAVDKAIQHMEATHARLLKEEADRAELERLRAEAEQRRQEEEARAAAEAERIRFEQEAKAKAEAEEQARQVEAARLAQIEKEAADRAAREAEEKARAEQEAKDRAYEEQIAELNRTAADERMRAEAAEAARKAEADRIAQERLAKEREVAAEKAAEERRQADQKHRAAIMTAAKLALMEHADIAEDVAKRVVLAIVGGNVPAVTLKF